MVGSLSISNFSFLISTELFMITKSISFKVIVFVLLVVLVDQFIGYTLYKLYFTQRFGQNASLNYAFKTCKTDILIFGNSRAQHHYDTRIIEDCLQMSCYNAGQDGGHSILMQYAQIKIITERYSPKIIILEFSPNNVSLSSESYEKLSILLPYYSIYPELRPLILLRGPYERLKLLSAIYPFNSNIINILRFNTNTHAARKKDFQGFVPINDKVLNLGMLKIRPEVTPKMSIDTNMVNALKDVIRICKEKEIKLFIISSPIFHQVNEIQSPPTPAAKIALDIIRKENIAYLDFTNDPTFAGHPDWFADNVHLNGRGATVFSKLLSSLIIKNKEKNDLSGSFYQ